MADRNSKEIVSCYFESKHDCRTCFLFFIFCNWVESFQWTPWFCHLLFLIEMSRRTPCNACVWKYNQEPGRKAIMAKELWADGVIELRRTKWWKYQNYLSGIKERKKNHRQGLKQDPQTLQLELRLEAAGDVREGIKRGYKIWAEGFAKRWEQCLEVSQKGKGTSLRLKIVEDNIYKAFLHLRKPPRCSILNQ